MNDRHPVKVYDEVGKFKKYVLQAIECSRAGMANSTVGDARVLYRAGTVIVHKKIAAARKRSAILGNRVFSMTMAAAVTTAPVTSPTQPGQKMRDNIALNKCLGINGPALSSSDGDQIRVNN